MIDKQINRYFFILLSLLPISFIIGPSVSLSNIIIFDVSFLILLISKKKFNILKDNTIKILLVLYAYLIFNTFVSLEPDTSFPRNFGFLRFLILFIGINYFFQKEEFFKIINVWSIIILIVVIDIFFERYFGHNIFGYGKENYRVVSFFKDEAIPGGYVYSFSFIIIGYLFNSYKKNENIKNILIIITLLTLLISVIITGERSNSFKFILSLIIFVFFLSNISFKKKILIMISFLTMTTFTIMSNEFVKGRMFSSIKYASSSFIPSFMHGVPKDNPSGNLYAMLYRSGFDVFKRYPFFGVGNKNYRIEACNNNRYQLNVHATHTDYICMTHPHQIYFEFLSEHGIIGTFVLLYLFFLIFFKMLKVIILEKNYLSLGCFAYVIVYFTPILPSGAFFTDYNLSLFFINLSLGYASSKGLNIFKVLNEKLPTDNNKKIIY
jgi:O-antigen ligase